MFSAIFLSFFSISWLIFPLRLSCHRSWMILVFFSEDAAGCFSMFLKVPPGLPPVVPWAARRGMAYDGDMVTFGRRLWPCHHECTNHSNRFWHLIASHICFKSKVVIVLMPSSGEAEIVQQFCSCMKSSSLHIYAYIYIYTYILIISHLCVNKFIHNYTIRHPRHCYMQFVNILN